MGIRNRSAKEFTGWANLKGSRRMEKNPGEKETNSLYRGNPRSAEKHPPAQYRKPFGE